MSGIGKYPFLSLERSNLCFGEVLVGEQVQQSVQLLNQGLVPAEYAAIHTVPGTDALAGNTIGVSPSK